MLFIFTRPYQHGVKCFQRFFCLALTRNPFFETYFFLRKTITRLIKNMYNFFLNFAHSWPKSSCTSLHNHTRFSFAQQQLSTRCGCVFPYRQAIDFTPRKDRPDPYTIVSPISLPQPVRFSSVISLFRSNLHVRTHAHTRNIYVYAHIMSRLTNKRASNTVNVHLRTVRWPQTSNTAIHGRPSGARSHYCLRPCVRAKYV